MKCAEVKQDLLAYSEGAVGRCRYIQMRAHIGHCQSCREQLALLNASRANLSGAMQEPVDVPDVAGSVMAMLGAEQPITHRPRRKLAVAFAAASVVAGLSMALWVSSTHHPSQPTVTIADAPKHTPKPEPKPAPLPEIAQKPDVPDAPREAAKRPPAKVYRKHKPARVPERHFAKTPPAVPQSMAKKQPEPEAPVVQAQPSYVVVVTTVPVIEVCSRNASDGAMTSYTKKCDEDGRAQVIEVIYTPANPNMEGPKT